MRLLLTSVLLSLPLASLASLEGGAPPGAEPTTTSTMTSTQTLTRTLAGNTVTSTLPSGEATPLADNPASTGLSLSSSAEVTTSQSSPEESVATEALVVPSGTSIPDVVVSTYISTSATGAPYPIPETSVGINATGTAAPIGTGAPIVPPQNIEPFQGAASKFGGQNTLMALAAVFIAGLTLC